MNKVPYLRSRRRRGRWSHYYKRLDPAKGKEVEISLGVHGLDPDDPRVLAAWAAEHARWQECPPDTKTPAPGTLAWAVDLYMPTRHWASLAKSTQQNRLAILRRYVSLAGDRPVSSITTEDIEATLFAKGGFAAHNELKALKPIFANLKGLHLIKRNPAAGVQIVKPKSKGFLTAGADEIEAFQKRWEIGTTERLIFDLALLTGAARTDLARLGRKNIQGDLLRFQRQKTGVTAEVPFTPELREVIGRTPDIAPAFILSRHGKPYKPESLGNKFRDAAVEVGMAARLHGLRKAFCVYWAEQGATSTQIAAMGGHSSLSEVDRYTRAADRTRLVKLLVQDG